MGQQEMKETGFLEYVSEEPETQIAAEPRATGQARTDRPLPQSEPQTDDPQCFAMVTLPELGSITVVFGRSVSIGRSPDNAIVIRQDSKVSRYHCRIFRHGRHFYIEDLGSKNGTVIDRSLWSRKRLSGGETIWLGDTEIDVQRLGIVRQAEPASR